MKSIPVSNTPQLIHQSAGHLLLQAEGGDIRVSIDGSGDANLSQRKGLRIHAGQTLEVQTRGDLWAVAVDSAGAVLCVQGSDLVAVDSPVGAVGLITLPTFTSGTSVPLSQPTTAPDYHGPRSLILTAPSANTAPVFYSQFANVVPVGGGFDEVIYPVLGFGAPWFDWTSGSYWAVADGKFVYSAAGTTAEVIEAIQKTINELPAGNYELVVNISNVSATGGIAFFVFYQNTNEIGRETTAGSKTFAFAHAGGPIDFSFQMEHANAGDYAVTLNSAVLNLIAVPAGRVGTPLAAGVSTKLTAQEIDLTRPIYVVGTSGETGEQVIANYLY